jgi:hypothetical protein
VSDLRQEHLGAYVRAAAETTGMPLREERAVAVTAVMTRIADFAADLEAFELADDVEIAGAFRP